MEYSLKSDFTIGSFRIYFFCRVDFYRVRLANNGFYWAGIFQKCSTPTITQGGFWVIGLVLKREQWEQQGTHCLWKCGSTQVLLPSAYSLKSANNRAWYLILLLFYLIQLQGTWCKCLTIVFKSNVNISSLRLIEHPVQGTLHDFFLV